MLSKADIRVLHALERKMKDFEYVPIEVIARETRLPPHLLERSVSKLNSLKLIERRVGHVIGYRLTVLGYDILAVHSLVKRGIIKAIGEKIGVGKESDVYLGVTLDDRWVAVKFHRLGRKFHQIVRKRDYGEAPNWLLESKISAEKEYKALEALYERGAQVPKPIAYTRHVVVTEYIEGVELSTRPKLKDPADVLAQLLLTIRVAYVEVGIVHGDLSEYNVLIDLGNEKAYIMDWPQYLYKDHPASGEALIRDLRQILKFFRTVYGVTMDLNDALRFVRGEVEKGLGN